jgi:predicted RND superfamily exporter protein
MMTLLPLLLVKGRADLPEEEAPDRKPTRRERFEQSYLKRPRLVLVCGAALTVFALAQFHKVHFDYNLLNLQTRDLPAVGIERKLIESGSESLLYGVVIADSLPQAVELDKQISRLPSVAKVVSMAGYLSEDPQRKLALIRDIKTQLAAIQLLKPDTSPVDLASLGQTLFSLQGYLGLGADVVKQGGGNPTLEAQLRSLREAVGGLQAMLAASHARAVASLTAFQQELFADLRETVVTIRDQDAREGLKVADVPPFLRHRFISRSGKFMLQVYSKDDLWQRDKQERFVRELRTVAPNVTGSPVQFYEYTSMLKDSFQKAAGYAGAVIAFLVYLHFRRISSVLLAFLPVALGVCWMLGLMGFFGIPFNPVNIIALTLVIGIGVTNGIHILNRFAEESHPSLLARSTGKAVLVSALTTMAGFGSLMVAKHQGIASLGQVMLMGTGMCMIASLAFLPAVLNLLNGIGWTMIKQHKTLRELLRRRKAACAATEVPRG